MKAFPFDRHIVESYARFSQSFSTIRAPDLRETIEREYKEGRFWPDALLSLNPRYEAGPTADDLVNSGDVCSETAQVFPFGSKRLPFYRHQGQAFAKARAGQSFVVTTGTGSGKSLCFFVPIVDAIIRARKAGGCLRCLLLMMYTHPFAKKALTLHLASSEGHERYLGCNLMHRNVLASFHQHLMAEAPKRGTRKSRLETNTENEARSALLARLW